uniref:Ribosomal protein S17 n=1 Tax=Apicomplexa sp. corallicolid ex Leiopathes glaberrima TaxID=2720216 RepID=A0A6M3RGZ3_9APIC|nr:ribosomal protein S17 [Apicomplexa sp. corallicolid ex Leiopathes glaberrima]
MKPIVGYVYNTKMNKKLSVLVPYHKFHKKYKKLLVYKKIYIVSDFREEASEGDLVLIRLESSKYNKKLSLIKIFFKV